MGVDAAVEPVVERTVRPVTGTEYLHLATQLLQTARRASATGGVWEAADLQWWWRRDQHPDPNGQTFWFVNGVPTAAVVLMNWGDRWQGDLLSADPHDSAWLDEVWSKALEQFRTLSANPVELILRSDDRALIDLAKDAGFETDGGEGTTAWMEAAERPTVPHLLPDFVLTDRTEVTNRPHPFVRRNGGTVTERLAECSLYRPSLDLAIYAPNGDAGAYGLFWADPITRVGLVEPMRTEAAYQGLGLARHLLAVGLDRLARSGCSRLKVSFDPLYEPARRLYLDAGFQTVSTTRTYVRDLS
ncbi:GCN5-related N-acetyltransferase, partial [mine drainage metagenome]